MKRKRAPKRLPNEDHPADLFGTPEPRDAGAGQALETIPLPAHDSAQRRPSTVIRPTESAVKAEPYKVGPGKPPLQSRWKKGGPSPNPKGRPRKSGGGRITVMLAEKVTFRINGTAKTLTKREVVDLRLCNLAIERGGPFIGLWRQQQEFDRDMLDLAQKARSGHGSATGEKLRAERAARDIDYWLIERAFPGLLDTFCALGPAASRAYERQKDPNSATGAQAGSSRSREE